MLPGIQLGESLNCVQTESQLLQTEVSLTKVLVGLRGDSGGTGSWFRRKSLRICSGMTGKRHSLLNPSSLMQIKNKTAMIHYNRSERDRFTIGMRTVWRLYMNITVTANTVNH